MQISKLYWTYYSQLNSHVIKQSMPVSSKQCIRCDVNILHNNFMQIFVLLDILQSFK